MVKEEHKLKTVFQKLVKVWENTEKLLKQSLTTSCSHNISYFLYFHSRFYSLIHRAEMVCTLAFACEM